MRYRSTGCVDLRSARCSCYCFLRGRFTPRCRAFGIEREYVGCVFGASVLTAKGPRQVGGTTKTARAGQRYDADGRGSEVVALAECDCGLSLGRLLYAVLKRHIVHSSISLLSPRAKDFYLNYLAW